MFIFYGILIYYTLGSIRIIFVLIKMCIRKVYKISSSWSLLSILEIYEIHIFANFCDINIYDLLYRHGQGRVITIIHATQGFQNSTNMEPYWASNDTPKRENWVHSVVAECFWLLEDYLYSMEMNIPEVKIFSN